MEQLQTLEAESVHICVTSPPYYNLRDYGVAGQIGMEETPEEYIDKLVDVFREVQRCLRPDGTLWVNIGDSYATRSGPQPPANTRNTFDAAAIREPCGTKGNARTFRGGGAYTGGRSFQNSARVERESHGNSANETRSRNKRSVWSIATGRFKAAHYATFPERLVEPCILAGCPEGGTVLDPFAGSGTTGAVAKRLRRNFVGVEINPDYWKMATDRITNTAAPFEQLEITDKKEEPPVSGGGPVPRTNENQI